MFLKILVVFHQRVCNGAPNRHHCDDIPTGIFILSTEMLRTAIIKCGSCIPALVG